MGRCSNQGSAFPNEQVLEIGQVGRAGWPDAQDFSFYAHSQQAPAFGDPTTLLEALQQAAQQTTEAKVGTSMMIDCLHMSWVDVDGYRLLSKDAAQSQNFGRGHKGLCLVDCCKDKFSKPVLSANSAGEFGVDADFCTNAQDKPFCEKQGWPCTTLASDAKIVIITCCHKVPSAVSSEGRTPPQHLLHTVLLSL